MPIVERKRTGNPTGNPMKGFLAKVVMSPETSELSHSPAANRHLIHLGM
jgi:hypothetical protein